MIWSMRPASRMSATTTSSVSRNASPHSSSWSRWRLDSSWSRITSWLGSKPCTWRHSSLPIQPPDLSPGQPRYGEHDDLHALLHGDVEEVVEDAEHRQPESPVLAGVVVEEPDRSEPEAVNMLQVAGQGAPRLAGADDQGAQPRLRCRQDAALTRPPLPRPGRSAH